MATNVNVPPGAEVNVITGDGPAAPKASQAPVSNERVNYKTGPSGLRTFMESAMRVLGFLLLIVAVIASVTVVIVTVVVDGNYLWCTTQFCQQMTKAKVESSIARPGTGSYVSDIVVAPRTQVQQFVAPAPVAVQQAAPQRPMVVIGGQGPSGPAPHGKRLVKGRAGDPGCVPIGNGQQRCPNRWE